MGRPKQGHREVFKASLQAARERAAMQPPTGTPDAVMAALQPSTVTGRVYVDKPMLKEVEREHPLADKVRARMQPPVLDVETNYEEVEMRLLGDFEKGTGIYAHGARPTLQEKARQAVENPEQFPTAPDAEA